MGQEQFGDRHDKNLQSEGLPVERELLELMPALLMREMMIVPVAADSNSVSIVSAEPLTPYDIQKLQFIMNRDIHACGPDEFPEIRARLNELIQLAQKLCAMRCDEILFNQDSDIGDLELDEVLRNLSSGEPVPSLLTRFKNWIRRTILRKP